MKRLENTPNRSNVIAAIQNQKNPEQVIAIKYIREENAFATDGISRYFASREILIPAHLVAQDIQLIGTIISAVLEKMSKAGEMDTVFEYTPSFEVLGVVYTLREYGDYMKLDRQ